MQSRVISPDNSETFSHLDQFLCMAFAQLTFRDSLRDIEVCLRAHASKLYHLGIRGPVARSTLADANEKRRVSGASIMILQMRRPRLSAASAPSGFLRP